MSNEDPSTPPPNTMILRNAIAILLLIIGSLQMIGYLTNQRMVRGIGLASGIAPFTKVFCEADGYEAFAATFELIGTLPDGTPWSRPINPELYSKLHGPYNRRNVYGAALSFAPRLPPDLRDHTLNRILHPQSHLRKELGIPTDLDRLAVRITPRTGTVDTPWTFSSNP